jgi:hypothetical protein
MGENEQANRVEAPSAGATSNEPGIVKVSFNLPKDEADELRQLAARRNTTLTQTLRSALANEKLLRDEVDDDGKVLIETKRGRLKELILPK